ncbi:MAG: hypothetical protein DMG32_03140 [Acidobacteria bacterium]|nr:MAG: hypothetical protein DMG32_03140 [Acidobacteriota bacterium]
MSDSHYIHIGRHTVHPMWRFSFVSRFIGSHLGAPVSVLAEQASQAARVFTDSWNKFLFRRFWGESISSRDVDLVIDSYENVVLRNRFRWRDSARKSREDFTGEVVEGTFSPQATAMLTALFLRHTGKGLRIVTDVEEANKQDGAVICYGSSDSNFKTFELEAESGGALCQFTFNDSGKRGFRVGGNVYSIEKRDGVTYDKAILLRLLTRQQDSSQCQVVCAGLSEWGSLAAVHYLVRNWKVLHRRFDGFGQRRDFCVLLEVPFGHCEEARELASAVWWHRNGRVK